MKPLYIVNKHFFVFKRVDYGVQHNVTEKRLPFNCTEIEMQFPYVCTRLSFIYVHS